MPESYDPVEEFVLLFRMQIKSRDNHYPSSFEQQRKAGIFISGRLKGWNDAPRVLQISKMRHFVLSALFGKTITSQKQMDAGEHNILIDMLQEENQIVFFTAELIEKHAGTEPRNLYGNIDTTPRMPNLRVATDSPEEHRHARSPHNEGACTEVAAGPPKPYQLPF